MNDAEIIEAVRKFINTHRDGHTTVIELICEFCLHYGLSEDIVGYAISQDKQMMDIIRGNLNYYTCINLENF